MSTHPPNGPTQFWLAPHIAACSTIDGAVLLDLKRNRYLGVGASDARALQSLVSDWPAPVHPMRADPDSVPSDTSQVDVTSLLDTGLLVMAPPARRTSIPTTLVATSSLGEEIEGQAHVDTSHTIRVLRAYAWSYWHARFRSFWRISETLSKVRAVTNLPSGHVRANLEDLVSTFRGIRPSTFVARDRCLVHALALTRYLAYYEVECTWVVGVRTRPWAAHSWVQHGSLVLDSTPEKVTDFTPILAV